MFDGIAYWSQCWICGQHINNGEQLFSALHPYDSPCHKSCADKKIVHCTKCKKEMTYTESETAYWNYPKEYCQDCISSTYPKGD